MPLAGSDLARHLRSIAASVAIVVAVSLPLGYWLVVYSFAADATSIDAVAHANLVYQRISANPELWRFEVPRLELIAATHLLMQDLPEKHTILDERGTVLAQSTEQIPPPLLTRSVPLHDSGNVVGQFATSRSLLPLLQDTALVALFGLLLALASYVSLSVLPLRAITRLLNTIEQERKRLRTIVDNAVEGIVAFDRSGVLQSLNPAAARMFSYGDAEAVGRSAGELLPEVDITRYGLAGARPLSGALQTVGRRKDGSSFPIELSIGMASLEGAPQLIAIARDITERKQAQEVLRQSEERHRTIIQTALDGFWLADAQGRLIEVNETYCRMSGYSMRELLSMRIPDLEASEAAEGVAARMQKIVSQGHDRFESRHRRKDGSVFDVAISVQFRPIDGGRFVGFIQDITERKQAEQELRRSQRELRGLSKAANEALEAERRRTARELHDELGQLLTALKMDLESLQANLPPNEPDLGKRTQAMRAMLDVTIAATRRIAADLRPLMLDDLGLAAALDWLTKNFSKQTSIATDLFIDETVAQVPEPIASALYRITQESLTNVTKYAHATTTEIRLERDGDWVQLTVRDDGRGIGDADQGKSGTFGLLGIRERVMLLSGEIAIRGESGRGSEVCARIPLASALKQ